jgi:hypothetical protein
VSLAEKDIRHIARQMLDIHGYDAEPDAAAMERKMAARGDDERVLVWRRISGAIRAGLSQRYRP